MSQPQKPPAPLRQSRGDRVWIVLDEVGRGAFVGYLWAQLLAVPLTLALGWGVGWHPLLDLILFYLVCCGVGVFAGGLIGLDKGQRRIVAGHHVETIEQEAHGPILKGALIGLQLALFALVATCGLGNMALAVAGPVFALCVGVAAIVGLCRGLRKAAVTWDEKAQAGIALARSEWCDERLERWGKDGAERKAGEGVQTAERDRVTDAGKQAPPATPADGVGWED